MSTLFKSFFRFILKHSELLIWITALLVLFFMNVSETEQSICFFKFAGISWCPGCGIGHSMHYAMHGAFIKSFQHHPIGIFAVIILLLRIKELSFHPKPKQLYE